MVIWFLFALMTTAATAAILHPLASNGARNVKDSMRPSDVYRDQLRELDREVRSGQIDDVQYQYARAETARRLFKAVEEGETAESTPSASHKWLRIAVVLLIPVLSIGFYVALGAPEMPSQPLAARLENPGNDMAILVAKAERHLAQHPDDGKGWDVLAPIYFNTMRVADAENAYRHAIRLLGPSAARLDGLAETLMATADGVVTEDARQVLEQSLRLQPDNPKASFYLALGLEQAGKAGEAKAAFEALAKQSPAGAPWLPLVTEHIAKNGGALPSGPANAPGNPTAADVAAAENLNAGDQQQMIKGMVASLDARLTADPNNLEGWLRLVRSYVVLKDKDRAVGALQRALAAFPASSEQGKQLLALARELDIATEGMTQ